MGIHSRDKIARVAYELYMRGGCLQGRDLEYWLEAQKIVEGVTLPASEPQKKSNAGEKTGRPGRKPARNTRKPGKSARG
jgi:hypothetical protein